MEKPCARSLEELREACRQCRACGLAATRQNVVFGEGNSRAKIFLLGEAPGAREDESGRPFVGRAGELLSRLLWQAGLERGDLFITGSIKCRPPRNRNPRRAEMAACRPVLNQQLDLIRPRIIVCLGLVAAQNLLGPGVRMGDVRGQWFQYRGYRVYPTYHPAAVLRHTVSAGLIIEDFRTVKKALSSAWQPPQ